MPAQTRTKTTKIMKYLGLALGLAAGALVATYRTADTHAAPGNGTQHLVGDFTAVVDDDCTGELVDVDVGFKSNVHITVNNGGGFHVNAEDVYQARGIGESSGIEYLANQTDSTTVNLKVGQAATLVVHFSMISKGGTPNLEVHALQHLTINANGQVTALIDKLTVTCQ
jgi:hypothetical protein